MAEDARRGVQRQIAGEHVVAVGARVLLEAHPHRGVALRVEVDEQRPMPGLGDAGGEIHGGRGLAHAALLVGDRVDGSHRVGSYVRGRTARWFGPNGVLRAGRTRLRRLQRQSPGALQLHLPTLSGRLRAIPARRGNPAGRRRDLLEHVQVPVRRPLERLHPQHLGRREAELLRRRGAARLLVLVPGALPRHQHAALAQERAGVLGDHRQRRQGARRDRVVGLAPLTRGPVLGPLGDRAGVLDRRPRSRAGRSPRTCGSVDSIRSTRASGQRNRQRQAREARAGAQVGDPRRAARAPRTSRPVRLSARWRSAASAPRTVVGGSGSASRASRSCAKRSAASSASPCRAASVAQRFTGNGQDSDEARTGETTSRRSGSSPSLCVSMSVRSAR